MTDFGMARLGDQSPQATYLSRTMCPGTDVYMPPEAVQDKPVYTAKIDCFSFGVITVQILTRLFPNPGDRRKVIEHPGLPSGMVEVRIPEKERRQNHINKINTRHTLLKVALDCLKDTDVERPSAQQLCERIATLKKDSQYSESVLLEQGESVCEQELTLQLSQQAAVIQAQAIEKDRLVAEMQCEILRLQQQLDHEKVSTRYKQL